MKRSILEPISCVENTYPPNIFESKTIITVTFLMGQILTNEFIFSQLTRFFFLSYLQDAFVQFEVYHLHWLWHARISLKVKYVLDVGSEPSPSAFKVKFEVKVRVEWGGLNLMYAVFASQDPSNHMLAICQRYSTYIEVVIGRKDSNFFK